MIHFAHPTWLWLLLLIPAAVAVYLFYQRWRRARLKALASGSVIREIITGRGSVNHHLKFLLQLTVFALLVMAFAQPQTAGKTQKKSITGGDVIICLDVSNSMLSEDIRPNRLIRAKQAISTLLKQLDEEQVGLVVFAGEAYIQVPLTIDKAATAMLLNTISAGDISNQGTAMADAINLAVRAFGSDPMKGAGKTIILVTDGEDHEGSVLEEAKLAAEQGITLFTLGLGSPNGVPVPVYKDGVLDGYRKDAQGNTVLSAMNPQLLTSVAEATGGKFYLSQNLSTAMQRILGEIRKQKTGKRAVFSSDQAEDQYQWFALIALALLALERMIPYRSKGRRLMERLDQLVNQNAKHQPK
jgi:Ca-activated chloride channel family protein